LEDEKQREAQYQRGVIMIPKLGIVVPCYNEEEVLPETSRRLIDLLSSLSAQGKITLDSCVYFVDDGSKDATWSVIESLSSRHSQIAGIKLSRNRGHQNALLAGLFTAEGDVVISVDADLQDDLDAIGEMLDRNREGAEVVYGVRKLRETDTFFKRISAESFYRLLALFGAEVVYNHADYRLMSRRALEGLMLYKEVNLFLRGIVPLIGYRSAIVYYDRHERFAGESKYPLKKMLGFAWEAITSFSIVPLRAITAIGFIVFLFSIAMVAWVLGVRLFTDQAVPGWASAVLPVYLLGGIQILCIGILGEYLGKTYSEIKERPRYLIEKIIDSNNQQAH